MSYIEHRINVVDDDLTIDLVLAIEDRLLAVSYNKVIDSEILSDSL